MDIERLAENEVLKTVKLITRFITGDDSKGCLPS